MPSAPITVLSLFAVQFVMLQNTCHIVHSWLEVEEADFVGAFMQAF